MGKKVNNPEGNGNFDIKELAKRYNSAASMLKQAKTKNHIQPFFVHTDIEKTYEYNLKNLNKKDPDYDAKLEHIQSVLSAGPGRFANIDL